MPSDGSFMFVVGDRGWVRDQSGAWHHPGHTFPVRVKFDTTLAFPRDWRMLWRIARAWICGETPRVPVTIDQNIGLRLGFDAPEKT